MANPSRRGQVAGPVTGQMRGDADTPFTNTSFILPYGLRLQQTINAGTTSVTIPDGITFVYAIAVGSGGGGSPTTGIAGGAGGIAWGWTLATSSCVVGAGPVQNTSGNYTRYGNIIAGGGGGGQNASGSQTNTGGNGGNGLAGGGGGGAGVTTGTRNGGNGGNGINILTGAITTGGNGQSGTGTGNGAGGGGAGVAGNGNAAASGTIAGAGGLGGGGGGSAPIGGTGGRGGDGILYLFY